MTQRGTERNAPPSTETRRHWRSPCTAPDPVQRKAKVGGEVFSAPHSACPSQMPLASPRPLCDLHVVFEHDRP